MSASRSQQSSCQIATSDAEMPVTELPLPWACSLQEWLGDSRVRLDAYHLLERPTLGIVSSHFEQNFFASIPWQRRLEAALRLAKQQQYVVVYSSETPYATAIEQACRRWQIPYLVLHRNEATRDHLLNIRIVADTNQPTLTSLPFLDRAVIGLSRHIFAIALRKKGKISELLERRLQSIPSDQGTVFVAWSVDLKERKSAHWLQEWLNRGGVGWFVSTDDSEVELAESDWGCRNRPRHSYSFVPRFPLNLFAKNLQSYLVHCTRARQGPWPDQSLDQFYDEVMMHPWRSTPTPIHTLVRILKNQRLVATSLLKSSPIPTISLSACQLPDLLKRRSFQSHLGRWDWEPYGLMISKTWLQKRGCTPVTYLERKEFHKLPLEQTTFSQPFDTTGAGRDWRSEEEWRLKGDLRLHDLPFSQGMIFVRTNDEARQLESLSRWPICVVDETIR